jgi:hypothetical protein
MPLGILDYLGRPFSLAVIAKAGREDLIFQFLSAFEVTFPKRVVPPQLIRTDDDTKEKLRPKSRKDLVIFRRLLCMEHMWFPPNILSS